MGRSYFEMLVTIYIYKYTILNRKRDTMSNNRAQTKDDH